MLVEAGVGGQPEIGRAKSESQGLGLFVRSLVGMDRSAAKEALGAFLADKSLGGNQIEFANLVVDHLTEHGVLAPERLYESPFTDVTPRGPDELFSSVQIDVLLRALATVARNAHGRWRARSHSGASRVLFLVLPDLVDQVECACQGNERAYKRNNSADLFVVK